MIFFNCLIYEFLMKDFFLNKGGGGVSTFFYLTFKFIAQPDLFIVYKLKSKVDCQSVVIWNVWHLEKTARVGIFICMF